MGGAIDTIWSLLWWPCDEAFKGDRGDDDLGLCGDMLMLDAVGGLKMTLEFELLKGRRAGFVTEGIGAWLVMGTPRSNMSSWNICSGSLGPENGVALAMMAKLSFGGKR